MTRPGFRRSPEVAARRARVLEMRNEHRPDAEIAAELGIALATVRQDYHRALEAASADQHATAHLTRSAELAKLDQMERAVWTVLRARHVTVSGGKIVQDENGESLLDDGPVLNATDRLVKIAARRATLLGLDAPARSRVEVITAEMIEAEIQRLEAGHADDPADRSTA